MDLRFPDHIFHFICSRIAYQAGMLLGMGFLYQPFRGIFPGNNKGDVQGVKNLIHKPGSRCSIFID